MTTLALQLDVPAARAAPAPRLLNRNFVLLWQAQLVSQFGNQAFTIAMIFWTAETTRSATMTGLMLMAGVLPLVLLGPLTGTFVDRQRSRLRVVVACDLVSGVAVLLLAAGFLAGPAAWRPAMLFATAIVVGICNAFFDPAVNALAPQLVSRHQLEGANAFRQSSRQVTMLVAQGLGGILYVLVGPLLLFLLNGLSFLFAGITELLIEAPAGEPRPARRLLGEAMDGFRYVAAQSGMIGFLVAVSIFNALLMPISVLLPVYATAHLHADARWYGFLLASIGAGAFAGCMIVGAIRTHLTGRRRRAAMIGGFAALAIALAALGQVESRWVALAVLFGTGVVSGMINVLVVSIIQRQTADEFRGRVVGLHAMMSRALVPIGTVAGGALADLTGRNVPLVYGCCGVLALATVTLLAARRTRTFLATS
jgi:DHA3 family macrolide efflux protein-like MFS transporter